MAIEYKEELPAGNDGAKKEFLGDVSSFANASGGDLIYGIRELRDEDGRPTGIPDEIVGVNAANPDALLRQLESVIRDGIAPRIGGLALRIVDGPDARPVLIIRVPRSWEAPHVVRFADWNRFYSRSGNSKVLLDVHQLRQAFLRGPALGESIRRRHLERLSRIVSAETPTRLKPGPLVCAHAIPFSALDPAHYRDVSRALRSPFIQPLREAGFNPRYNVDGVLAVYSPDNSVGIAYTQVFRDGSMEWVVTDIGDSPSQSKRGVLHGAFLAAELIAHFERINGLLELLEVAPPVAILVTIVGARDYLLDLSRPGIHRGPVIAIDRDQLNLPEVIITSLPIVRTAAAKPVLDALWQSVGLERCHYYDEQGTWKP